MIGTNGVVRCCLGLFIYCDAVGFRGGKFEIQNPQEPADVAERPPLALSKCAMCMAHGFEAPIYYQQRRKDGVGAVWGPMLTGMALAHRCGMNFGGVLNGDHVSHGVAMGEISRLFGVEPSALFPTELPANRRTHTYNDVADMPCPCQSKACQGTVMLNESLPYVAYSRAHLGNIRQDLLTHEFLQVARSQFQPGLRLRWQKQNVFVAGRPSVALHIRRGNDVPKDGHSYTPDSWYLRVVALIRVHLPNADVHVWSEGEESDFQTLAENNMTLHIADPHPQPGADAALQVFDVLSNFYFADLFVAAKSSLSWFPSVLRNGCVIYEDLAMASSEWFQFSSEGVPSFDAQLLKQCKGTTKNP